MTGATPSPMQTPDIGGLLRRTPPAARPIPPPAPPATQQDAEVPLLPADATPTQAAAPSKGARRRSTGQASAATPTQKRVARAASGRQYLRSIAVYLPRSVHQQIRVEAAASETTATALILAAVNATHGHVGEVLDKDRESPAGRPRETDLFEIPQARKITEPTVQTTIRVTDAQLQAITELAAAHDANRSQLITAALRLHLAASP